MGSVENYRRSNWWSPATTLVIITIIVCSRASSVGRGSRRDDSSTARFKRHRQVEFSPTSTGEKAEKERQPSARVADEVNSKTREVTFPSAKTPVYNRHPRQALFALLQPPSPAVKLDDTVKVARRQKRQITPAQTDHMIDGVTHRRDGDDEGDDPDTDDDDDDDDFAVSKRNKSRNRRQTFDNDEIIPRQPSTAESSSTVAIHDDTGDDESTGDNDDFAGGKATSNTDVGQERSHRDAQDERRHPNRGRREADDDDVNFGGEDGDVSDGSGDDGSSGGEGGSGGGDDGSSGGDDGSSGVDDGSSGGDDGSRGGDDGSSGGDDGSSGGDDGSSGGDDGSRGGDDGSSGGDDGNSRDDGDDDSRGDDSENVNLEDSLDFALFRKRRMETEENVRSPRSGKKRTESEEQIQNSEAESQIINPGMLQRQEGKAKPRDRVYRRHTHPNDDVTHTIVNHTVSHATHHSREATAHGNAKNVSISRSQHQTERESDIRPPRQTLTERDVPMTFKFNDDNSVDDRDDGVRDETDQLLIDIGTDDEEAGPAIVDVEDDVYVDPFLVRKKRRAVDVFRIFTLGEDPKQQSPVASYDISEIGVTVGDTSSSRNDETKTGSTASSARYNFERMAKSNDGSATAGTSNKLALNVNTMGPGGGRTRTVQRNVGDQYQDYETHRAVASGESNTKNFIDDQTVTQTDGAAYSNIFYDELILPQLRMTDRDNFNNMKKIKQESLGDNTDVKTGDSRTVNKEVDSRKAVELGSLINDNKIDPRKVLELKESKRIGNEINGYSNAHQKNVDVSNYVDVERPLNPVFDNELNKNGVTTGIRSAQPTIASKQFPNTPWERSQSPKSAAETGISPNKSNGDNLETDFHKGNDDDDDDESAKENHVFDRDIARIRRSSVGAARPTPDKKSSTDNDDDHGNSKGVDSDDHARAARKRNALVEDQGNEDFNESPPQSIVEIRSGELSDHTNEEKTLLAKISRLVKRAVRRLPKAIFVEQRPRKKNQADKFLMTKRSHWSTTTPPHETIVIERRHPRFDRRDILSDNEAEDSIEIRKKRRGGRRRKKSHIPSVIPSVVTAENQNQGRGILAQDFTDGNFANVDVTGGNVVADVADNGVDADDEGKEVENSAQFVVKSKRVIPLSTHIIENGDNLPRYQLKNSSHSQEGNNKSTGKRSEDGGRATNEEETEKPVLTRVANKSKEIAPKRDRSTNYTSVQPKHGDEESVDASTAQGVSPSDSQQDDPDDDIYDSKTTGTVSASIQEYGNRETLHQNVVEITEPVVDGEENEPENHLAGGRFITRQLPKAGTVQSDISPLASSKVPPRVGDHEQRYDDEADDSNDLEQPEEPERSGESEERTGVLPDEYSLFNSSVITTQTKRNFQRFPRQDETDDNENVPSIRKSDLLRQHVQQSRNKRRIHEGGDDVDSEELQSLKDTLISAVFPDMKNVKRSPRAGRRRNEKKRIARADIRSLEILDDLPESPRHFARRDGAVKNEDGDDVDDLSTNMNEALPDARSRRQSEDIVKAVIEADDDLDKGDDDDDDDDDNNDDEDPDQVDLSLFSR